MVAKDNPTPGPAGCDGCRNADGLGFEFTMAFQPIVDTSSRTVYAHEALVRGLKGEGAASILSRVDASNRYAFDQACRVRAIELATSLGMQSKLSINFLPNAVYRPQACIRTTLSAARRCGFPLENIMFELTEDERATDLAHLAAIFDEYGRHGFVTAIDDFGAGYAGLELLAAFQPHIIKIDMGLVRGIDSHQPRRSIVAGIMGICTELGIRVIAEGVETAAEFKALRAMGVTLFQGYLFARPALQALPAVDWRALEA
ncbi:EAL domain-containing protein [Variovorax ginsengisoli]|uniref:EAL domain-containing protein (Putative c-di-GMP-specific phosphodiesterase class I) n=1 Tax=Variovorax ginsengisoli TaxID=363844 RepID=A0ABT9S2I1_9BURK|nr:EAL domain-containing protein [Variovorax ginsengisoli]MDP9898098.1 EAL domain-containing protein (putative c-di-GMP-specific phosphodiesterase class I) [Variovorax ginsengisoli]